MSHCDSLSTNHRDSKEKSITMQTCIEESTDEITMWEEPEEVELPTNGLDEIIDWDRLERGLDRDEFSSKSAVAREIKRQFEEAGEPWSRRRQRMAMDGLFPEYRSLYATLPIHAPGDRVAA